MKILKFGGSSIQSPERIQNVSEIVQQALNTNQQIAIVVSAFGGVTDELCGLSAEAANGNENYKIRLKALEQRHLDAVKALIEIRNQSRILANVKLMINELEDILHGVFLIKELTLKTLDLVLSTGERLSAYIIAEYLQQKGLATEFLDARQLVKTNAQFGSARIDFATTYQNINNYFKAHSTTQVITGFIGSTANNETTTLGRGGSDYTASTFGAALNVDEIEVWTDVDGVMTSDPRKVPAAFPIESLTYEEAMEMSHFGAKVIYPPTIQPALENKIPVRIKNTLNPDFTGTVIAEKNVVNHGYLIKGISSFENIAILRVQGSGMVGVVGIAGRLFSALAQAKINVILITQASSEHSICFAIQSKDAEHARTTLEHEFSLERQVHQIDEIVVEQGLAIIAAVGENMRHTPGIAGKLFQALGNKQVNVMAIAQGSSELNISIVIRQQDEALALNAIHEIFFA